MSDNNLGAIRARLERTGYKPWKDDTFALLAEVERLRAVRTERDRYAATLDRVQYLADVPTVASYEALTARLAEICAALEDV